VNSEDPSQQPAPSIFPPTRWSIVLEAQTENESVARRALSELCETYWYPLYAFARRKGLSPHDAEDRTQEFLAGLLRRESLSGVSPDKGRLRAFLLTAMKRSLSNQRRHENAAKRGGTEIPLSIDLVGAESRLARELSSDDSPDRAFERSWAHALLGSVYRRLEVYYETTGQTKVFARLRHCLAWGGDDESDPEIAAELGMSEGAVRSTVHRLRNRYREYLESEIRDTVATEEEAREELAYLKRVLTES
jgi:RNA polymerase sigma-70 factor (ECF subfamily)